MKQNRIYSDLHQEFKEDGFFHIAKHGDEKEQNLIIAGDLYHLSHLKKKEKGLFFQNFFSDLSERFNKVFLVYGNHDFYGGKLSKQHILDSQSFFDQFNNVFVLSRHTPSITDEDTVYVGATLWTDFGGQNHSLIPHHRENTESNDFKYITYISPHGYTKFKPVHWINEFLADSKWIKSEVENNKDKKIVVVTHFAPSKYSYDDTDPKEQYSKYYKSNLDDFIINNPHINFWFHGHIHTPNDFTLGDTKIFSNPIGYKKTIDDSPELSLYKPKNTVYKLKK